MPGAALLRGQSRVERVGRVLLLGFDALLVVGGLLAVADKKAGAVALLVWFGGLLAIHLAIGVWGYRRVMSHPWPDVAPLSDDDDW